MKTTSEILRECLGERRIDNQDLRYTVYQAMELYAQQWKEESDKAKAAGMSIQDECNRLVEEKAKLIEALKMVLEADLKQSGSEHSIFTFDQQLQIQKAIL